jgi:hypothetical protein
MACRDRKDSEGTRCPFCDAEIMKASLPFCQACKVTLVYCPACRKTIPKDSRVCPKCGAAIKSQD